MVNKKFEAYKVKREIRKSGNEYLFYRNGINKFNEPDENMTLEVGKLMGLYHEGNSYISVKTGETTQSRNKKVPMILCLFDDTTLLAISKGDFVQIGSNKYVVTGITDIQNWNIIADISLEVVDNGI